MWQQICFFSSQRNTCLRSIKEGKHVSSLKTWAGTVTDLKSAKKGWNKNGLAKAPPPPKWTVGQVVQIKDQFRQATPQNPFLHGQWTVQYVTGGQCSIFQLMSHPPYRRQMVVPEDRLELHHTLTQGTPVVLRNLPPHIRLPNLGGEVYGTWLMAQGTSDCAHVKIDQMDVVILVPNSCINWRYPPAVPVTSHVTDEEVLGFQKLAYVRDQRGRQGAKWSFFFLQKLMWCFDSKISYLKHTVSKNNILDDW